MSVAAEDAREIGARVAAFVSAERDGASERFEDVIFPGSQRLFDESDAAPGHFRSKPGQIIVGPALVDVGDEISIRNRTTHCRHPFKVGSAGQLQLEQIIVSRRGLCRRAPHRIGRIQT